MQYDIAKACSNFCIDGELIRFEPYGNGHINDTFLVVFNACGKQKRYILQRINHGLFKNVDRLMENVVSVTEFLRRKIIERSGDPERETLTVIKTKQGKPYYFDGENYFRLYPFIEGATAYSKVEKPEHFYQSAIAFGKFANLLAEFDASKLYETITQFHDTEKRYNDLLLAIENNVSNRKDNVKEDIDFVLSQKDITVSIKSKLLSGELPLKVTHNDTKFNNVMIDDKTGKAICVIDLDTVMPGSILYDFGDAIRFGCNTAEEDEKDCSLVKCDLDLFEQYVKGYLFALGDSVQKAEAENLALGAIVMTYENGIRFLADYLNGDTYFHTKYAEHNLVRARCQFALYKDMINKHGEMNAIVKKHYKN